MWGPILNKPIPRIRSTTPPPARILGARTSHRFSASTRTCVSKGGFKWRVFPQGDPARFSFGFPLKKGFPKNKPRYCGFHANRAQVGRWFKPVFADLHRFELVLDVVHSQYPNIPMEFSKYPLKIVPPDTCLSVYPQHKMKLVSIGSVLSDPLNTHVSTEIHNIRTNYYESETKNIDLPPDLHQG